MKDSSNATPRLRKEPPKGERRQASPYAQRQIDAAGDPRASRGPPYDNSPQCPSCNGTGVLIPRAQDIWRARGDKEKRSPATAQGDRPRSKDRALRTGPESDSGEGLQVGGSHAARQHHAQTVDATGKLQAGSSHTARQHYAHNADPTGQLQAGDSYAARVHHAQTADAIGKLQAGGNSPARQHHAQNSDATGQLQAGDSYAAREHHAQHADATGKMQDDLDSGAQGPHNARGSSTDEVGGNLEAAPREFGSASQYDSTQHRQIDEQPKQARSLSAQGPLAAQNLAAIVRLESEAATNEVTPQCEGNQTQDVRIGVELQNEDNPDGQRSPKSRKRVDKAASESQGAYKDDIPPHEKPLPSVFSAERSHQEENAKAQQLRQSLRETRLRLKEALDHVDILRRDYNNAAHTLHTLQAQRNYSIDDDTLGTQWDTLRYHIKNWAATYFIGDPTTKPWRFLKSARQTLTGLVEHPVEWLRSSDKRQYLAQAFVWTELRDNLFAISGPEKGLYWAGSAHAELRTLRTILSPYTIPMTEASIKEAHVDVDNAEEVRKFQEYHRWRALTTALVRPSLTDRELHARVQPLLKSIVDALSPYAVAGKAGLEKELCTILKMAVTLDAELQTQRALFVIVSEPCDETQRPFGFVPQARLTTTYHGDEPARGPVELMVTPALVKYGNAAGEHYEHEIVIARCQAFVKQSEPNGGKTGRPGRPS
ncbi:hypothetical protein LTR85_000647 [Meristemomyces frigidus]|nr:hypothetical protein LTR85_000647 [Meristemomyces frigidus]